MIATTTTTKTTTKTTKRRKNNNNNNNNNKKNTSQNNENDNQNRITRPPLLFFGIGGLFGGVFLSLLLFVITLLPSPTPPPSRVPLFLPFAFAFRKTTNTNTNTNTFKASTTILLKSIRTSSSTALSLTNSFGRRTQKRNAILSSLSFSLSSLEGLRDHHRRPQRQPKRRPNSWYRTTSSKSWFPLDMSKEASSSKEAEAKKDTINQEEEEEDTTNTKKKTTTMFRFADIGANLLDERYTEGTYRGSKRHEPDFDDVVDRAEAMGMRHLILTSGTLEESRKAIDAVRSWRIRRRKKTETTKTTTTKTTTTKTTTKTKTSPEGSPQDESNLDVVHHDDEGKNNDAQDGEQSSSYSSSSYSSSSSSSSLEMYCTVGVHPTRTTEMIGSDAFGGSVDRHVDELIRLAEDGMRDGVVVAIGEVGLDYDRLQFSPMNVQREMLPHLLRVASVTGLPLFLHNRNAQNDLRDMLMDHKKKEEEEEQQQKQQQKQQQGGECSSSYWKRRMDEGAGAGGSAGGGIGIGIGVVHSFDDTLELAEEFISMGLYIGLNGCSLRTEENLMVVRQLPLNRILLETDCPYCDVRRTHAGYRHVRTPPTPEPKAEKKYQRGHQVKGRNEPCNIRQIAEIVAGAKGMELHEVVETCYANTLTLYGWKE